jgi:hypothetical protein
VTELPPEGAPESAREEPPADPRPNPRRNIGQSLLGVAAGLGGGLLVACVGVAAAMNGGFALLMAVITLAGAVYLILVVSRRRLTPFANAFFLTLAVVLLLCSACSGLVVMSNRGPRLGG